MVECKTTRDYVHEELERIVASTVNEPDIVRLRVITRGVRSSLRSKKVSPANGLLSDDTNCVGALIRLQETVSRIGFDTRITPVIARRLPWQHADASYSIHIAGMVEDSAGNHHLLDPTPSLGYLYGQSGVIDHKLEMSDRYTGGIASFDVLSDDQYKAIQSAYRFEAGMLPDEAADETLAVLSSVPAYFARFALKLWQYTEDEKYKSALAALPPGVLRGSYTRYLDREDGRRHALFTDRDDKVRRGVIIALKSALSKEDDLFRATHIEHTLREITGTGIDERGDRHPLDQPAGENPIFRHELHAIREGRPSGVSNSYFFLRD